MGNPVVEGGVGSLKCDGGVRLKGRLSCQMAYGSSVIFSLTGVQRGRQMSITLADPTQTR
jgi:hypothetical protein